MIRILSYNVLFGRKWKKIFPWLARQSDRDIICLQEFPESKISELLSILTNYSYSFAPSMRIFKKIYGELTLYRTDRLTCKKTKIITLGQSRVERTLLLTKLPRTALLTEFAYKRARFVLVNPQLVSLASNTLRYRQVDLILAALKPYTIPSFIIGDFNIPSVVANNKLNVFMKANTFISHDTHMHTYRLGPIRYQTDYAFARSGKIEEMKIEKVRFSDHYPIHITAKI